MTKQSAIAAVVLFWCSMVLAAAQLPLASAYDASHAQLLISRDGSTMTIRGAAPDTLRLCVEPAAGVAAPTHCFSVGQIRHGLVDYVR